VADAELAGDGLFFEKVLELGKLADGAPDFEVAVDENGDAGGVIPAVLKFAKTVHEDVRRVQRADIT
jgi:hypothetical protein